MAKAIRTDLSFRNISSIEEALKEGCLFWDIYPSEVITNNGIDLPNYRAMIRDDNNFPLSIVSNKYTPIKNIDAFSFIDTIVGKEKGKYSYTYVIDGGRQVIVQAQVGDDFDIVKGDTISRYITIINSFDGSKPLQLWFSPLRLFCRNQLRASIKNAEYIIKIRHTSNIEARLKESMEIIAKSNEYFTVFKNKSKELAQKIIDKKMVDNFLNECFGDKKNTRNENQKANVIKLFESGKGNKGQNAWELYNAVVEYVDYEKGSNVEKRLASAMVGSGSKLKEVAWESAIAL